MRCPKCNSRGMIEDYNDTPDSGSQDRVLLCVCCGKRVYVSAEKLAARQAAASVAVRSR